MPVFEAAPRGFAAVTLAFVGYALASFGLTVALVELGLPNQWFMACFVGIGVVLAVPFVRLFRQLVPKTPGTA
ncbi:hypothetical protein SAMN04487949_1129 [Halogranum gelatinilyticum]|uniref:Uncharacterized protein n=1 Tax=Halogranum gelatinilyticum TaxID=660521 RepID=A0A1G9R1V3_9EURY|nr:hypothetical protein [Halogranum gelatinilyticum]SDM17090.1 hypothetical protein SAMN04487949_1129 [Halogranum gelatinilyticum]